MLKIIFQIALFTFLLSGCSRQYGQEPAEVVYRTTLPHQHHGGMQPVTDSSAATQPSLPGIETEIVIGLVLPLSGENAEIGAQLRDAALMGLYDTLQNAPKLQMRATPKLLIRDNQGDPDRTGDAVRELITLDAKIIIGPLKAENTEIAGRITHMADVPLISFTNNMQTADEGVYAFGFVPQQQVERVAQYAANNKIEHFAAIAPQSEYGRMVVRDFSRALEPYRLNMQPVEFFSPSSMPSTPAINRIMNQSIEWGSQRKAIFLPVTGKPLSAISLRLLNNDKVNNGFLKLLGTGLWDNPQTLNDPGMQGAWFATTSPDLAYDFNEKFVSQYDYAPSRIASLGYDAVHITANAIIDQAAIGVSNAALLQANAFHGPANGAVRFYENGMVERGYAIIQVANGGFAVIEEPRFNSDVQ